MQVVITMAGLGKRFSELGFRSPKPVVLLANYSTPIEYVLNSFPLDSKFLLVLGEHLIESEVVDQIHLLQKKYNYNLKIIYCSYSSRGPVDTVLAACESLNPDEPILISYCDLAVQCDFKFFLNQVKNYSLASFDYQGFHPTYFGPNTYCHILSESLDASSDSKLREVSLLQEKKGFTRSLDTEVTSCGVYYFLNKNLLVESLKEALVQNLKYGNEFYISQALQAMRNKYQTKILDFRIEKLIQFGTPEDIERFNFWYLYFKNKSFEFQFVPQKKRPLEFSKDLFEKEKTYWQELFHFFKIGIT